MSQNSIFLKNQIRIPFLVTLIAALLAVVMFFLPYITMTGMNRERIENSGEVYLYDSGMLRAKDMAGLSLFKYAKIYFQYGTDIMGSSTSANFYGILMSVVGGLILFALLAVLGKKPILIIILDILLCGTCYIVYWDFVDRGIMPREGSAWGVAYYGLYICTAIIAVGAIWMLVVKKKIKREAKKERA